MGAHLLNWLIPNDSNQEAFEIKVEEPDEDALELENGVYGQSQIINNVKQAQDILNQEQPDKVVTLGGNCMVSQAPFDYLNQKYGDELGIVWIDTHPDISYPKDITNEHAMVVANLLGEGDSELSKLVNAPLKTNQFLYVGLQELLDFEAENLEKLNFDYKVQGTESYNYEEIQQWIKENNFSKIAIHFDIDVLDPNEFRATYFAEPHIESFPAAAGQMSLSHLNDILKGISENNDIVGFTVAEYMPWDEINLKNTLKDLNIFH
ncbi:MAG: arginase family protein [Staphylococcus saprophyticus]|uniref:arginase family protein n=1 Tax=Staphylococcus saprophyticus TaxID=29385 RepID=UPI001BDEA9E5|nr:arginase family protein [Staphylococcus saprophyticus]MCC4220681.1 arginase family protein [Staphylococcus saprophyticus]HJG38685.1 arginase family protein [Staphylococcus saprophyticus]